MLVPNGMHTVKAGLPAGSTCRKNEHRIIMQVFTVMLLLLMPPPGRGEVREREGGAQEDERRKGQRGGSVPPPVVVPACRPLRGWWVWQDS